MIRCDTLWTNFLLCDYMAVNVHDRRGIRINLEVVGRRGLEPRTN